MNWALAIDLNRRALLRLVAVVIAILPGGSSIALSRRLRTFVLRTLRPAESAARRLVMIAAREMSVPHIPKRSAKIGVIPPVSDAGRVPCFRLYDPRKRFDLVTPTRVAGPGPRLSIFGYDEPVFVEHVEPSPDDLLDASKLRGRLLAVQNALEDLPRQARRLMRMQARRSRIPKLTRLTPIRPGWPPGYRTRPRFEVDEILRECHALAIRSPIYTDPS